MSHPQKPARASTHVTIRRLPSPILSRVDDRRSELPEAKGSAGWPCHFTPRARTGAILVMASAFATCLGGLYIELGQPLFLGLSVAAAVLVAIRLRSALDMDRDMRLLVLSPPPRVVCPGAEAKVRPLPDLPWPLSREETLTDELISDELALPHPADGDEAPTHERAMPGSVPNTQSGALPLDLHASHGPCSTLDPGSSLTMDAIEAALLDAPSDSHAA